jgi:hypothetical protein
VQLAADRARREALAGAARMAPESARKQPQGNGDLPQRQGGAEPQGRRSDSAAARAARGHYRTF